MKTRTGLLVELVPVTLLAGLSLALVGCASVPQTRAQELALERFNRCNRLVYRVQLDQITPDGTIFVWHQSPEGWEEMKACMRRVAAGQ